MNNGLADSYSLSKGGVLLQLRNSNNNNSSDNIMTNYDNKASNSRGNNTLASHNPDFRSVWIPKKYEGRNMFASHIDSAIFPNKTEYVK
jgi:hypothetical protein